MPMRIADVIEIMNRLAPPELALPDDPNGLRTGRADWPVRRVLVALDVSAKAVAEARRRKCQLLIVHHPPFYRGLRNLAESAGEGELAAALVRAKLAVFAAHTNLDTAPGGVNDALAEAAGLRETRPLAIHYRERLLKLAVFVPESHLTEVREAVCDAGAGQIGEYSNCTFRVAGTGTFRGSDATNPFLGQAGKFEEAAEWRLETILPESLRPGVEAALRAAHPYEEPAYDFYLLADTRPAGLGRVGELPRPVKLGELARKLKKACRAPAARGLGDPQRSLRRLAVWSGGGCPAETVIASGAEAVVLGEMRHHELELYRAAGVGVIELGHGPSEEVVLPGLAANLAEALPEIVVEWLPESVPSPWPI